MRRTSKSRRSGATARAATSIVERLEDRTLMAVAYPASSVVAPSIDLWGGTHSFTVKYDSATSKVRRDTLDNRDVTVIGPNGYSRNGKFYWADKAVDHRRLYARYKVPAPAGFWSAADNGVYEVWVNKGQVRDIANNPTRLKLLGSFTVNVPAYPTTTAPSGNTPPHGTAVRLFGATPNDGIDDTDAIQAAIDSLPQSAGVPNGISPIGGYVTFEEGEYLVSRSLWISSGIWLRGVGDQTVLHNVSTTSDDTAIRIYSAYTHGGVVGTRVMNMRIVTDAARGIQVDPHISGDANNLRLENLSISAGNIAIDFRAVDVYQSSIINVAVEDPGAAALWLRVGANNSAINNIHNFQVRGTARPDFDSGDPLVSLGGSITVDGLTIEDIGAPLMPLYVVSARGAYTGVSVLTSAANLLTGEVIRFEHAWIRMDRFDGFSSNRRLRLISTRDVYINRAAFATDSTVADSIDVDPASHLTVGALYGSAGRGTLQPGRATLRQTMTGTIPPAPALALRTESAPASNVVVNINDFGAFGNDPYEDTAAIQAAIDSLPTGDGIPGNGTTVGGTVLLPRGTYLITTSLRVPSGVWLVGDGWGSVIRNTSTDPSNAGIVLVGNAGNGMNIGAGLINLGIDTFGGASIRADASVTGGLIDLRVINLALDSASSAVALGNVRLYRSHFESILVHHPRGTSFWIGDDYSAENRVVGLLVIGNVTPGASYGKAHVVLQGQTTLEHAWIEPTNPRELPLYVSGAATIRGMWLETHFPILPDNVNITFENITSLDIDVLPLVDDLNKIKFRNATGVRIQNLDIAGRTPPLSYSLDLDSISRLSFETVNAIYDVGMLDDPRIVSIGGAYNKTSGIYTDTWSALNGPNLLADPNMTNVGSTNDNAWKISFNGVTGTFVVEQTANGPRLKVVVTSNSGNGAVRVDIKLSGLLAHLGKQAIGRYRVDGPGTTILWGEEFAYQYVSRVSNSLTAAAVGTPISEDTGLVMVLPGIVGTYYISQVGLVANT